jgi:hypothetical protein
MHMVKIALFVVMIGVVGDLTLNHGRTVSGLTGSLTRAATSAGSFGAQFGGADQ